MISMQCVSQMSKHIRSKMSPYLPKIIPQLIALMIQVDPKNSNIEQNDLADSCLETLNQIVKSCPREVASVIPDLFKNAVELCQYDPNYVYDDNVDMKDDNDDEGWGSDFEQDAGE